MLALILAASPWMFYGGANVLDLTSTEVALHRGAIEGGLLVPQNRAGRVAVKAAQTALLTYCDQRMQPKGRKVLRILYVAGMGYVVAHNLRQHGRR